MSICTAKVTGKHRTPWRRAKCPACGQGASRTASLPPPALPTFAADPRLADVASEMSVDQMFAEANDESTSADMLAAIAMAATDDELRKSILANPNVNADVLRAVHLSATDPQKRADQESDATIALRSDTPDDVLVSIAQRSSFRVLSKLASRSGDIPQEAFTHAFERAKKGGVWLMKDFAAHKSAPLDALEHCLVNGDPTLMAAAARNTSLPLSSISQESINNDPGIQAAVAAREDMDGTALRKIVRDMISPRVLDNVLSNPSAPEDLLLDYTGASDSDEPNMSHVIVTNPGASANVLRALMKENKYHSLSWTLAEHPNSPDDVLEELAAGELTGTVARALSLNPNTPMKALPVIVKKYPGDTTWPAQARINEKMRELGIDEDNDKARESIIDSGDWWEFTADSPEVFIARTLHGNRER